MRRNELVQKPGWGRAILAACSLAYVASLVVVAVTLPDGVQVSADATTPAPPLWSTVAPHLIGILLVLLLPWPRRPQPVVAADTSRLRLSTVLLLVLAAGYPLLSVALGRDQVVVILAKAVMLIVLAALVVGLLKPAIEIHRCPGAWRWWAPAVVLGIWFWMTELAPWHEPYDPGDIDLAFLVVAATVTALTASVGEELFFRRWLQSRLEATIGAWPGIALASLLFAVMHLGSHGSGDLLADLTRVIAIQGSFGLFMGVLWWRYRILSVVIIAHLVSNGWGVVAFLATGGQ